MDCLIPKNWQAQPVESPFEPANSSLSEGVSRTLLHPSKHLTLLQ